MFLTVAPYFQKNASQENEIKFETHSYPNDCCFLVALYFIFGISEYNDAVVCLVYNYSVVVKYVTNFFHVATVIFASINSSSFLSSLALTLCQCILTVGQAVYVGTPYTNPRVTLH